MFYPQAFTLLCFSSMVAGATVIYMAKKFQRVGLQVSAAGGVENAPENAKEMGAECFQFFSRSPRGGGAPAISDDQAKEFKARSKQYGMPSYIHTPYYINFASLNKRIYHGSISAVREELERGSQLGVDYVMTHLGSAKDHLKDKKDTAVPNAAIKQAIKGLRDIYKGNPKLSTKLLLEISAGAGAVLGDSFEELAALLKGMNRKDVFVCLDTCHMFASGYEMRDAKGIEETMKAFRKHLGVSRLKLVHVNDSKAGLGEHKDRHEHIGKGEIGAKGFKAMLAHKDFQKVNFILETKHDAGIKPDMKFLKQHRKIK